MKNKKSTEGRRIVYISTSLGVGGAAKRTFRLARYMRSRKWDVKVITLLPHSSRDVDENKIKILNAEGVECLSANASKSLMGAIRAFLVLFAIARLKPDLVHSNSSYTNVLSRFVKILAPRTKIISTIVNYKEGGRILESMYRLTDFMVDQNVHLTKQTEKRYLDEKMNSSHKTIVIPNGVSLCDSGGGDFQNIGGGGDIDSNMGVDFRWVCVAALHEKKDHLNLLKAFVRAKADSPDVSRELLLLGDGSKRKELEDFVDQNGLQEDVVFYGVHDNPESVLNACDGFVLSSRREGHSNALLEALSLGLPVVCTDVGGNSDVVKDGENGFLVPKEDSQKLASAMVRLENMAPGERAGFGEYSKKMISDDFSDEQFYSDWVWLYQRLIAAGSVNMN